MSILASLTRGRLAVIPGAIAASALIFAGCSGGDGGGGGSDEDYVEALCGGLKDFSDDLTDILSSGGANEEEAFEDLADAIRALADVFDDANPPSDVREANDALVVTFREAADKIAEGDETAFDDVGDGADFELPEDVQDRLAAVAEDNETCQEVEESGFGDLFGAD